MSGHHFISYSPPEALNFVLQLADALEAGPPSIDVWVDKRKLRPGDWDTQIVEAIRTCESLLFVMTHDSVQDNSVCKDEWTRALMYKKPIIPLKLHPDVELPFRLGSRQSIDFTGDFDCGIGKTAMVCRLLKSLERGQLPNDMEPLNVDGIVYLSASGSRRITVPNLYSDLSKLLPSETADLLDTLYKNPQVSTEAKMQALLEALPKGCIVLLLDNFEDVIDPETRNIRDAELDQVLRALLNLPQNPIKVILTTRITPFALTLLQPGRQKRINLDEGLELPDAENLLRQMDADGKLGLQSAPDNLLAEACERTRGYPRALEALYAILAADRNTSLREILDDTVKLLPENVVEVLVGEAFSRLDATAQKVMQALAIYVRPVTPAAIDYLLQPYLSNVNSAPVLARLVNMQLVRKEIMGRYYLHPVDREYALGRVPQGKETDRDAGQAFPFTQFALWHRGADYFKQVRTPSETWKKVEDLEPQLAEFELCYAGHDYDRAASVVLEIGRDYLFRWGYYQLIASLHERLKGKLSDSHLEQASLSNLGNAYRRLGDSQKAKTCLEQALTIARKINDRNSEAELLGSLGLTNADLSHYPEAISNFEQALAIDREIKDSSSEGKHLGWLGNRYFELGQLNRARKCYEAALAIAQGTGDRSSEGDQLSKLSNVYRRLGNSQQALTYLEQALVIARERAARAVEGWTLSGLGTCYGQLGQIPQASDYFKQALAIARQLGDRLLEGLQLGNLAELLIDEGRYEDAAELAVESQQVGSEINSSLLGNYSNLLLALTYLFRDDLQRARDAAETSHRYNEPLNNHYVLAVVGLIALRQGDRAGAQELFTSAVAEADAILVDNTNFWVLDSKGLALSGLTLYGHEECLLAAIEAYKAARAITKDMGVVGRVLHLFDALRQADTMGILTRVRQAAGGIE